MARDSHGGSRPWRSRHGRGGPRSAPPAAQVSAVLDQSPLRGECQQLCPPNEERERRRDQEISRLERPTAALPGLVAVKKYRRAAAGRDTYSAADLRPAPVLLKTLRHLFTTVLRWPHAGFEDAALGAAQPAEFLAVYHFVNDRVRSVRQDFTVQRIEGAELVTALQLAVRFYLLAGLRSVQLLETVKTRQDWSDKLNDEQLASALSQLQVLYLQEQASGAGEFIAYDLLLHADDPQTVGWTLRKLSPTLRALDPVQRAVRAFVALQTDDYIGFAGLFARMTLLEQCLAIRHLPLLWKRTMKMANKAFGKVDRFPLEELARWMCLAGKESEFQGGEQAERLCAAMNVQTQRHPPPAETANSTAQVDAADSWETIDVVDSLAEVAHVSKPSSLGFAQFKLAPLHDELDSENARKLQREVALRVEATFEALSPTELIVTGATE